MSTAVATIFAHAFVWAVVVGTIGYIIGKMIG